MMDGRVKPGHDAGWFAGVPRPPAIKVNKGFKLPVAV
jgi:hypothetical protein